MYIVAYTGDIIAVYRRFHAIHPHGFMVFCFVCVSCYGISANDVTQYDVDKFDQ